MENKCEKSYIVVVDNNKIIGKDMYNIIKELPLFNNYLEDTIDKYIQSVLGDFDINEEFILAIKSLNPINLDNLYIDEEMLYLVHVVEG